MHLRIQQGLDQSSSPAKVTTPMTSQGITSRAETSLLWLSAWPPCLQSCQPCPALSAPAAHCRGPAQPQLAQAQPVHSPALPLAPALLHQSLPSLPREGPSPSHCTSMIPAPGLTLQPQPGPAPFPQRCPRVPGLCLTLGSVPAWTLSLTLRLPRHWELP